MCFLIRFFLCFNMYGMWEHGYAGICACVSTHQGQRRPWPVSCSTTLHLFSFKEVSLTESGTSLVASSPINQCSCFRPPLVLKLHVCVRQHPSFINRSRVGVKPSCSHSWCFYLISHLCRPRKAFCMQNFRERYERWTCWCSHFTKPSFPSLLLSSNFP